MKKDFEEIYTEIYEECVKDLKSARNKLGKFVLGILLVLIVINVIVGIVADYKSLLTISISLSILVLLIFLKNAHKIYSQKYKDMVIGSLVKKYNQGLSFDSKSGLAVIDYRMSNFDNTFKEYYSEDRIYGTLEDGTAIQSSEITTYDVSHYVDSNGENKTSKTQTFRGYYGVVKLSKNPALEITILDDNFTKKYSRKRVEVDSSEFEKFYDCITNNRVEAMEIFTSDLIEKYIDIRNINKYLFEVKIINNMLYFRYKCGDVFEAPAFGLGLNKDFIRKYYKLIFYPLEVIEETVNHIYSYVDTKQ
jgi:hypothetical protein